MRPGRTSPPKLQQSKEVALAQSERRSWRNKLCGCLIVGVAMFIPLMAVRNFAPDNIVQLASCKLQAYSNTSLASPPFWASCKNSSMLLYLMNLTVFFGPKQKLVPLCFLNDETPGCSSNQTASACQPRLDTSLNFLETVQIDAEVSCQTRHGQPFYRDPQRPRTTGEHLGDVAMAMAVIASVVVFLSVVGLLLYWSMECGPSKCGHRVQQVLLCCRCVKHEYRLDPRSRQQHKELLPTAAPEELQLAVSAKSDSSAAVVAAESKSNSSSSSSQVVIFHVGDDDDDDAKVEHKKRSAPPAEEDPTVELDLELPVPAEVVQAADKLAAAINN